MKKDNSYLWGMVFLALAQILVSINIVASKQIVHDMPLFLLLIIRFLLAAMLILPLHYATPARQFSIIHHFSKLSKKDVFFLIAQGLSAGALFNCFMLAGLHFTDANIAGIITSTLPAIIALLSWLILKERLAGKTLACIVLATFGLVLIAVEKLHGSHQSHSFLGDFLVLLALFPEAAYYVLCKIHAPKLPVFLASSFMNVMNTLVLTPYFLWHSPNVVITTHDWLILVFLGINTALFYVFWYSGSQRIEGVVASLSTAIMPVATVLFAWLFLNEALTSIECLGMFMVLASIVINARR
ncbi:MAG TPA: EamA family transporter [Legionellales bacterium]|nr:EamA family transporter [Legionellales bacterium]